MVVENTMRMLLIASSLAASAAAFAQPADFETLEGLRQLATGYAPPLTFGPSRRLGARGAYLLRIDLARQSLEPVGGWVEAE